jgi:hypothetical protein
MLSAIEKNSTDFEKGKISKDFFKHNEIKMKKESAKIIKNINKLVDKANSLILRIDRDIESQKITEKKKGKKSRLSEIKRGIKKKVQESTPSETPPNTISETAPPEQKVEQGS